MSNYNPLNPHYDGCNSASQQMPQWEDAFRQGVCAVFKRWTVIQMCVKQEWAGHQTKEMINGLVEGIFEIVLNRKRKLMSAENETDVENLAEYLRVGLYEKCNAESEDDSDLEVSKLVLRLLDNCRQSDFSLAAQMVEEAQKEEGQAAAHSQIRDDTQYAEDADDDDIAAMGVDAMGDATMGGGSSSSSFDPLNSNGNSNSNGLFENGVHSNSNGHTQQGINMMQEPTSQAGFNQAGMIPNNQGSFPFGATEFASHTVFAPQATFRHVNNEPAEAEFDDDGFQMVRKKR